MNYVTTADKTKHEDKYQWKCESKYYRRWTSEYSPEAGTANGEHRMYLAVRFHLGVINLKDKKIY